MSVYSRRRLWNFFETLFSHELKESHPRTDTPEWIKTPMLPHQQAALSAALTLERAKQDGMDVSGVAGDALGGRFFTSHGILGDRVGSGKSLTALALVKQPAPSSSYTEFVQRDFILNDGYDVGFLRTRSQLTTSSGTTLRPVSTCLFIVPHALISQWESYIKNDTDLRAYFVKKRSDATTEHFLDTIERYDAIVVSSTMWSTLRAAHEVHTLLWKRVFIDEADSISMTATCDDLHALFYWFISASWINLVFPSGAYYNLSILSPFPDTPDWVKARIAKLGSQILSVQGCRHVNIVRRMCGVHHQTYAQINAVASHYSRLIVHSSNEFLAASFAPPTIHHSEIMCATPVNIRILNDFISADMMERLHAGDVHGALELVGMNAHSESELTAAVTASVTKELENARRTYEYKKSLDYSSEQAKQKAIETCEQRIQSLEHRIKSIVDRIKSAKDQTCPICFCEVSNPSVTPCCQQLFCFPCICESLKRTTACPLCRGAIRSVKDIRVLGTTAAEHEETTAAPAPPQLKPKRDTLLQFINDHPAAKILLFSGYDASLSHLEDRFQSENITYANLSGTQARINKVLRDFKSGKYRILFLNARNMGTGLNIESATHVVLYHMMSAELETQIIGRAVRLGRKEPLSVVHLLHENERADRISHV